jgi:DNA topoisomerase-1
MRVFPAKARPQPNGASDHGERTAAATRARLRYVVGDAPGIQRLRSGNGFRYRSPRGGLITEPRVLDRIRKLAVPPAWSNVWICPDPAGHLQATGRDVRGRKQYRYHARWRVIRDDNKFDRLIAFAQALPRIRRRVRHDLRLPGLPRDKVLATVVRLLETTMMRVGNEQYARQNGSFGLTTLRNPHAKVRKDEIHLEFRGKGGIRQRVTVQDQRVARIVKRCQDLPGQELFQYLDEAGKRHGIGSTQVNAYLQEASGGEYTAKDFRTWAATLLAAKCFQALVGPGLKKPTKRRLKEGIQEVAQQLGHTAAICRKSYIHPALIDAYLDGSLGTSSSTPLPPSKTARLRDEAGLLRWLRKARQSKIKGSKA